MHRPSRRSAAAVAVVASLGAGSAIYASPALAADSPAQPRLVEGLGGLGGLLGVVTTPVAPVLQPVLNQVVGLAPAEVQALVAPLTSADLGALLAGADLAQLTALITALTPEQVQAALATLTPQQQEQVKENMATAQAVKAQPQQQPKPAAKSPFGAYRATISSAVVNKTRRSMRLRVTCPANSPRGCFVRVSGQLAGRKAMAHKFLLLAPNSVQTTTVKLTSAATKRLKSKGGTVRLKTVTAASSIPRASKNATAIKAPKKKKSSKK